MSILNDQEREAKETNLLVKLAYKYIHIDEFLIEFEVFVSRLQATDG